jgi:aminoglycoside phosphotransferase (APT) family kinase protein
VGKGDPAHGYPWPWAICRWLGGRDALVEQITDLDGAAIALAHFISALRRIDASGGPSPGPHNFFRGVPLKKRDERTSDAIEELPATFDKKSLALAWQGALDAHEWQGEPSWIHGDLAAGNLLVRQSRIVGVLDWGGLAVADPACDLMIAWTLLWGNSRATFKRALDIDDATWNRARAWTLSVAVISITYYLNTNPSIVHWATHAIREVLGDSKT